MEINEQRYVSLFNAVNYFAFGTLWKIRNILWRKVVHGFVSKNDDEYHPAVCLGRKNLTSLYQTVPMLLGSHSHKTGFPIRDFAPGKNKKPSFFKIRPYLFSVADAAGSQRAIEQNEYKPHLEQDEISELKAYLRKGGIRFND